jgi:6-pyruvoyltetrahydropterin/6-carboxytetrahydropterin synthase
MYRLEVESEFSAAHRLREYPGQCERLHGHNWRVRLGVEGMELDASGMLLDFGNLKRLLGEAVEAFDHCFLNETPPFDTLNPTSENLARILCERIAPDLPGHVRIEALTVWESERCRATYRPAPPA